MIENNYKALAKTFWKQGYIVVDNFFDENLMSTSHSIIMSHFGESPAYAHDQQFIQLSKAEVVPWFPQREGEHHFDTIEQDPRLIALTEAILGADWHGQYCMVMFSKQGSVGQAWHQDCPPEDATQYNLNRLVYTKDINNGDGGEVYIRPQSHLNGALSKGPLFEDFKDQVVVLPKKGTLILLHGHCWHRIGEQKRNSRISTNYRAAPQSAATDITDICVYRNMRYQFSKAKVIG